MQGKVDVKKARLADINRSIDEIKTTLKRLRPDDPLVKNFVPGSGDNTTSPAAKKQKMLSADEFLAMKA